MPDEEFERIDREVRRLHVQLQERKGTAVRHTTVGLFFAILAMLGAIAALVVLIGSLGAAAPAALIVVLLALLAAIIAALEEWMERGLLEQAKGLQKRIVDLGGA